MHARRNRWTRPSTLLAVALVVLSVGGLVGISLFRVIHPPPCGAGGPCPPPPPWTWQHLRGLAPPGTGPMAYDPATTDFVLFAHDPAAPNCGASFSTWILNSTNLTWARAETALAPPSLFGAMLAFDPSSQSVVLFGGMGCAGALSNQTWAFGPMGWSNLTRTIAPPPREDGGMASLRGPPGVLLFGGFGGAPGPLQRQNDTWELQNGAWTKLSPHRSPAARDLFGLGVSPWNLNGTVELFGGLAGCPGTPGYGPGCLALNDTWRWDNGVRDWEPIPSSAPTPSRYDIGFGGTWMWPFLFGGEAVSSGTPLNDSWLEADNKWSPFTVPNAPPARSGADVELLGYSSVLVYGGVEGSRELNDTWMLPPPPTEPATLHVVGPHGGPSRLGSLPSLVATISAGADPSSRDISRGRPAPAISRTVRPRPGGRRGRAACAGSSSGRGPAR